MPSNSKEKIVQIKKFGKVLLMLSFFISESSFALLIDWNGSFGVDTTTIKSYRKIKGPSQSAAVTDASQEVALASGSHGNANFDSYVLKLSPTILVNDSASIKGEITTGYGQGGRLGETSTNSKNNTWANALYMQNQNNGKSLNATKFYMELYADTATYQIGRHTYDWGLGVLVNSGKNPWDRHIYTRDGVTANFKIGYFKIDPYLVKNSTDSLSRGGTTKEYGTGILYDSTEKDMAFGILYGKKESSLKGNSSNLAVDTTGDNTANTKSLGETDVKIIDLYLKKQFNKFGFAFEVPILRGKLGNPADDQVPVKYRARAFIVESSYELNSNWKLGALFGNVSGHNGGTREYEAMYLNPNYQVANILFRYNMMAVADPDNYNIYDSYITNTKYLVIRGDYSSDLWVWRNSLIYAVANQAAKAGGEAYNHTKNKHFTATQNQSDKLGVEVDTGFDYRWNKEITLGGTFGYLFTGDYFAFTNDQEIAQKAKNSYMFQFNAMINF